MPPKAATGSFLNASAKALESFSFAAHRRIIMLDNHGGWLVEIFDDIDRRVQIKDIIERQSLPWRCLSVARPLVSALSL